MTDLRVALGIPDSQGASKYGVVSIPKEDGSILQASLRVTNHQANANTYIDHDANYKYNLSIVVRRKQRKNTFIPNENVILDEYVYYGTKMQNVENPLTQIVNGIIVFLQSGEYKDTTGVAFKNQSVESKDRVPQNISVDNDGNYVSANGDGADYVSENKELNCNKHMNKKLIRLTENDLHRIVKESVNRVINEINLGNGSIDFDDWHITSLKSNEDGYYEFEARCDNDWYTLRGSYYGNGEIELDFLLSGHSGYGRQIPINKKLQRWFDIYGRKELTDEIEYWIDNNMVEEPNYDEEY